MFTEESIFLRNNLLSNIDIVNTNELKLLYKYLSDIKRNEMKRIYSKTSTTLYNEIKKVKYISESAEESISKLTNKTILHLQSSNLKVKISIYSDKSTDKFIQIIVDVIEFVCSLTKNHSINELDICYYLTDLKKINSEKNEYLTVNEINSGYCENNFNKSNIVIWRSEEIMKVTIHELFHALKYDFRQDTNEIIKMYQKRYNISSLNINTYETYAELWANLINCFLISQKIKRDKYNAFLILIYIEKEFVKYQCNKFSQNYFKNDYDINKYTNVLAYFFIRCELYGKLTQFIKFCRENNKNYVKINKSKWNDLLKKTKKLNFKKIKYKNDYLSLTTRMSVNEIDLF
jgi:hypothetical protein